jgi:hypothetical protein
MSPAISSPRVTIPGVSTTVNCCMWQIHKKVEGGRKADLGTPYACPTGPTARGDTRFELKLATSGPPCDQDPPLVPDGSQLEASGNTILRADSFAHFVGSFTIRNPRGTILFQGSMEVIDRVGTHHPPFGQEPCNPTEHFEGWLVGRGSRALPDVTLRALIVARSHLRLEPGPVSSEIVGTLNGVLIKCPRSG